MMPMGLAASQGQPSAFRTTALSKHFNQIGAKPSPCLVDRDYVVVSRQTRLVTSPLGSLQIATPLPTEESEHDDRKRSG
jgi:hypothetical protein